MLFSSLFSSLPASARAPAPAAAEMRKVLPYLDPYDNPMYMSLRDFARHPIATELLHNGGFFQVRGERRGEGA